MNNLCAVLLCNKPYFHKFLHTCNLLVTTGKYTGNICLVIGDDLHNDPLLEHDIIKKNNIIIKYFPDIVFADEFTRIQHQLNRPPHWVKKLFQYHKLHLFNTYFKQWEYIFYLDCGITIYNDITPILQCATKNTLLAHSDAYPTYNWKLHNQFDKTMADKFSILNNKYNLNIDYCQTTIMLYDTSIIEDNTYTELYNLTVDVPISITNDQGIIALYFTNIKPYFKQIPVKNNYTYFYDYLSRSPAYKYIMLKI